MIHSKRTDIDCLGEHGDASALQLAIRKNKPILIEAGAMVDLPAFEAAIDMGDNELILRLINALCRLKWYKS